MIRAIQTIALATIEAKHRLFGRHFWLREATPSYVEMRDGTRRKWSELRVSRDEKTGDHVITLFHRSQPARYGKIKSTVFDIRLDADMRETLVRYLTEDYS